MYGVLPQTMTKKSAQFDDNHEGILFYSVPQTLEHFTQIQLALI